LQFESVLSPSSSFVSCSAVVNLSAGDVVTINNAAGAAIGVGGSPPTGATNAGDVATLTIVRLA
jgi:hypothetical protein